MADSQGVAQTHGPVSPADAARDEQAVVTHNAEGSGPVVLVCEHASAFIPERYDSLGLSPGVRSSHAVWDPGALPLAMALSDALDAPLVASGISRLVHDCNRPPGHPSAMPMKTESIEVPGNVDLTPGAIEERVASCYQPFEVALQQVLDERLQSQRATALVTIHTFTPTWHGKARTVELGLLHDSDTRLVDAMLATVGDHLSLKTVRNEPYGPDDGVTWTLQRHAIGRAIPNVMIEIRNDLLREAADVQILAKGLAESLGRALAGLLAPTTLAEHAR